MGRINFFVNVFLVLSGLCLFVPTTFSQTSDLYYNFEQNIEQKYELFKNFNGVSRKIEEYNGSRQTLPCILCRSVLDTFIEARSNGSSQQEIEELAIDVCIQFSLSQPNVCRGLVSLNVPIFIYILDNTPNLTAASMCATVFQSAHCVSTDPQLQWTVNVDSNIPEVDGSKEMPPANGNEHLKIVQLSDYHFDPNYLEGANAVCGEPCCCRRNQGTPTNPEHAAGRWGDYRDCDTPWESFVDTVQQIAQHDDIDIIYFTGDIMDHGIWETTFGGNIRSIFRTLDYLRETFPNTPILPIIGNHEAQPTNVFAPSNITRFDLSTMWLYNLFAEEWATWLPNTTLPTIREGGYYTHLVQPGFRVIALNNQDCYTYNWWIMHDPSFPAVQLQWLHDTLLQAEIDNEYVHILMHIPSGSGDCFDTWSFQFRRIVERFWPIIGGIFNGHTHRDEFNIYYSINSLRDAINVAWNGGSATPFSHVNTNYRIHHVETETYQVVDIETWTYNLTEANLNRETNPSWFLSYSFAEEYEVDDLSPSSLDELVIEMAQSLPLLTKYFEHTSRRADTALAVGCSEDCLKGLLCRIATTSFSDTYMCDQLTAKWDE